MADNVESTPTPAETWDPQKNIEGLSKDGKINAADLKAKLEASDQRSLVRNAKEGLKTYMNSNEKNKQEFVTMCEDMLLKNSVKTDTDFAEKLTSTDRATAKKQETFTPQERAYIGIAWLYLTIKWVEKWDDYATVKNFLTNKTVTDGQWKDLQLNTIVAPKTPVTEVVLDGKADDASKNATVETWSTLETKVPGNTSNEKTEQTSWTWGTSNKPAEIQKDVKEPIQNTDNNTATPKTEATSWWNATEEIKTNLESLDTPADTIKMSTDFEKNSKELQKTLQSSTDLYKNEAFSTLMQEYHANMNQSLENALKKTFAPMIEMMQKKEKEAEDLQFEELLRPNAPKKDKPPKSPEEIAKEVAGKQQETDFVAIWNALSTEPLKFDTLMTDGKLNSAWELFRNMRHTGLEVFINSTNDHVTNLKTNLTTIAPIEGSSERKNLNTLIAHFDTMAMQARDLLTDLGSNVNEKNNQNPAEPKFIQLLNYIQNNPSTGMLNPLQKNEAPSTPRQVTDTISINRETNDIQRVNEWLYSTFGLPNTLKNGKLDDIRTSLNQFKNNAIAHEINGEIIYFNKDQLDKQWLLWDTGEIKDESDQLLLDAKASGKVGAWSVSELVKDAHDNKNSIFFPNEDGKDIRELWDDKQQKRLEQLAEKPDTEMSEKREEKTFAEQDLASKLDKKASLSESRLILTDILKQPGLKRTALGMEKPEQQLLNTQDFLKLTIGNETRYISTNDYLDLTQDSRELSKREKNNIDDNQAKEAEKTRINYSSLAEQKYNITAFPEDWKVDTQGSKLTFANKETDQIIGLDMKNTDAPIFSFRLDNKPFSLTTSPEHAEKVFDRIQDLNDKYTSLQEAYQDKDTKSTDHVFQLGFLQDHASDLISGNEMTLDATTRTGIKDLPTGKQQLTIDNFIYDDATSLLSYSATDQKKKEAAPPPPIPPQADNQSTYQ